MEGDRKPLVSSTILSSYYSYLIPPLLQFEYQQAQLEFEIENLSWKIERAETTDIAVSAPYFHTPIPHTPIPPYPPFLQDIRQQINRTEVKRLTLLRDFVAA